MSDHGLGLGDRGRHFRLKNGVGVYGGFAGNETARAQRDPEANPTVLSGDTGVEGDTADNCWHVFYHPDGLDLDGTAVLGGFTVTGGNADGSDPHDSGGGMHNYVSSPTVTGCTFTLNLAGWSGGGGIYGYASSPAVMGCTFTLNSANAGGGMCNEWFSDPTVTNCTFASNLAGSAGGGMFAQGSPTVTNCTFASNSAGSGGGGIYSCDGSPTITDCTFDSNSGGLFGGGMCNEVGSPTVTNCAFVSNSASWDGGGIYSKWNSSPTVTNCTFASNLAEAGGGMHNESGIQTVTNCTFASNSASESGGAIYNLGNSLTVANCIFWGDTAVTSGDEIANNSSVPVFGHCDIEGSGGSGAGWDTLLGTDAGWNIDADPLFVDAGAGNLRLGASSPCIDAGDDSALPADAADLDDDGNTTEPLPLDLDGNPRVSGSYVDMGAYEVQQ
ncbi:MAG: choice-of-anchor Q domain-containing protein [Planctomycetota bacterium]